MGVDICNQCPFGNARIAARNMDSSWTAIKNSEVNILTRFLAQRGPYTSSGECDVQQEDQNGVEVMETSCLNQVQQRELW